MAYTIITVPENEVLTPLQVSELVRRDYSVFVTGDLSVDKFVKDNLLSYWLVTNTWLLLCRDIGGRALSSTLELGLLKHGLAETIKSAASTADLIIRNIHAGDSYDPDNVAYSDDFAEEAAKLKPREALQVLRYPKRFCPVVKHKFSRLAETSIKKFLETNEFNKQYSEPTIETLTGDYRLIVDTAAAIVREIVKDFPGFKDTEYPQFGPGAVRNCTNLPYSKYEYLVTHGAYVPAHFVPLIPIKEHPDVEVVPRFDARGKRVLSNLDRPHLGGLGRIPQVTRVTTVPKKVDAERVIAMEDPINMSNQLYLKEILHKRIASSRFGGHMPITRQEVNKKVAYRAALNNDVDTVDYSHASDSVTKVLVHQLFPDDWWRAFMSCIPTGFILSEHDAGPRRLSAFATMGCGCTFVVETIVFYALQLACWAVSGYKAGVFTLEDLSECNFPVCADIYAMGDDCLRPTSIGKVCDAVFERLGFSVNHDKTFTNGLFRESCGAEWLKQPDTVEDVTSVYWPRIPVKGDWDSFCSMVFATWRNDQKEMKAGLTRIIALQHNLYDVAPSASLFLAQAVRSYTPYMTAHEPGEICDDLWLPQMRGYRAYFVSGQVDRTFRNVLWSYLPDGYVLADKLDEWLASGSATAEQQAHLGTHRWMSMRDFHIEISARGVSTPKDGFYRPLVEEMRLELALVKPPISQGWPSINDGSGRTLADVCGLRPWSTSMEGIFGCAEVVYKFVAD